MSQSLPNSVNQTMQKLNLFLSKNAKALTCGPDCQKFEQSESLQQKYLDAQTNLQTAPIQLSTATKNYYLFTKGQAGYNTFIENDLQTKANAIGDAITKNFSESVNNAKTLNETYNGLLINSKHVTELYDDYLKENAGLEKTLRSSQTDIFTNDRKTYYEDQGIDSLKNWHSLFWWIYYIVTLVFLIALFISPSSYSIMAKIIILVFLVIYPYISVLIATRIIGFINYIYSLLPKNAYTTL